MANQYKNKVVYGTETIIDLSTDTVTDASHIMAGHTGHLADGSIVAGTGGSDICTIYTPTNYYDPSATVDGKLVSRTDGSISDYAPTCYIRIDVTYGDVLRVKNFPYSSVANQFGACYNSSGTFVYGLYKNESDFSIALNVENMAYVLINNTVANKNNMAIFINDESEPSSSLGNDGDIYLKAVN